MSARSREEWTIMHRYPSAGFIGLVGVLVLGCAAANPTPQLVNARQAYDDAANSPASKEAPQHLLDAQQALKRAEEKYEDDPGSQAEAHLAYIALRKAQLAQARGAIAIANKERKEAEAEYAQTQEDLRERAQENLSETRDSLQSTERKLQAQEDATSRTTKELEEERRARLRAEQQAAAAIASLREVAQVKEELNRTVITLTGSVLFRSNESSLIPSAQGKLERVAEAIQDQGDGKSIVIEGYTDSRGTEAYNQKLSQERAESVRAYLIQRGIDAARITAVGKGENNPIADNATAEGQANNRRVEIVIQDQER